MSNQPFMYPEPERCLHMASQSFEHNSDKHQNQQTRRLFYGSPMPHVSTAQGTPDVDHDTPTVLPDIKFFFIFFSPTDVRRIVLLIAIRTPPPTPTTGSVQGD